MLASIRDLWVRAALAVSLLLPVYFLIAALGVKFGLIDWTIGFGRMTLRWGPYLLYAAGVLGLSGLVLAVFARPVRGWAIALAALAIPAAMLGYGAHLRAQAQSVPPIHDISTDLVEPPAYSDAVVSARAAIRGANSLDLLGAAVPNEARFGAMAGRPVIEVQQEAYADIASIPSGLAPAAAFDLALELAREQPWRITASDKASGRIEGVAESFWYGFRDDIVIRVRADGAGSRIDMRSASRVGVSDLGANARRMRAYLEALRARVEQAES